MGGASIAARHVLGNDLLAEIDEEVRAAPQNSNALRLVCDEGFAGFFNRAGCQNIEAGQSHQEFLRKQQLFIHTTRVF